HGPEVPPLEQFLQRPRRAVHARDPYVREGDLAGAQPLAEAFGPFPCDLRMVRSAVAVQRDALVDEPEGVDLRGCAATVPVWRQLSCQRADQRETGTPARGANRRRQLLTADRVQQYVDAVRRRRGQLP